MITDSPRRQVPHWARTLLVVVMALALLAPGPWRGFENVGSVVLAPFQGMLSSIGTEVGGVFDALDKVRGLSDQNTVYRQEIDRLESELVRLRELEIENRDLRSLLGLKERAGPGVLLPVSVIARDDTPYVEAITVDRGDSGGVQVDNVVITQKGLVGRVQRVNATTAKVLLITDINSSVAVRVQGESRTTGVLRGQSRENLLVIDYIPQSDTVNVGDVVITSGLGEVFPEGLVVGRIARVQRKDADPFQAAVVEPSVDLTKLERLYVMGDSGKGHAPAPN